MSRQREQHRAIFNAKVPQAIDRQVFREATSHPQTAQGLLKGPSCRRWTGSGNENQPFVTPAFMAKMKARPKKRMVQNAVQELLHCGSRRTRRKAMTLNARERYGKRTR